tara:strand:- start:154 stop:855 length:702 start_codon:yes stop_codon:yes gene_type:complete
MARQGLCSRREADKLISSGNVLVNGEVIDKLGSRVSANSSIKLSSKIISEQDSLVTILLNKPPGFVSDISDKNYPEALDLIKSVNRADRAPYIKKPIPNLESLNVTGRLDIDSSGLLIFTQDGRIARKLISPSTTIEKEYKVRVSGTLNQKTIARLTYGIRLDNRQLRRAQIRRLGNDKLTFILKEGRKRQIRRMCEQVGLEVLSLVRVRIGNINLGNLKRGHWRHLTEGESF